MTTDAKRSAWYCVTLFCVISALSFVDRYILSLLAQDVTKDLRLSDTQMGLLLGLGFAAVYTVIGLPVAHLIDRSNRIRIVAVGVIVWSLATVSCAFATGFVTLGLSRAGIAAGEAVLTPAVISLIADLFPHERRSPPVAIYSAVATVMGTGALAVGAVALKLAHVYSAAVGLAPWRLTMIIIGAPGVVLALLLLVTVREPVRILSTLDRESRSETLHSFMRELGENLWIYLPFYVAMCALAMYISGFTSWAPTLLIRLYGLTASDAGYYLGVVGVPAAVTSAFFWPWLANRLTRRGHRHALLLGMLVSTILSIPVFVIAPLAGTAMTVTIGTGLMRLINGTGTLAPLMLQTYGRSQMRGKLMAIYTGCAGLVGLSGGAYAIPALAEIWHGNPRALPYAISLLGIVCAMVGTGALAISYFSARSITARRAQAA